MLLSRTIVSAIDRDRLLAAVATAHESWSRYVPHLDLFRANLRRARVVPPDEIPEDVITMNSCFELVDQITGESKRYKLVYPREVVFWDNAVSVLSPMGAAVLGAAVGEEVCWVSSRGPETARVERVTYQPEAARRGRA